MVPAMLQLQDGTPVLLIKPRIFGRMVGNSSRKPLPLSLSGRVAHDSARSSRHMPSDDGQILRNLRRHPMTAADFRRIALTLAGVEEYSPTRFPAVPVSGGN